MRAGRSAPRAAQHSSARDPSGRPSTPPPDPSGRAASPCLPSTGACRPPSMMSPACDRAREAIRRARPQSPRLTDTAVVLVGGGEANPLANAELARVARLVCQAHRVVDVGYAFLALTSPSVGEIVTRWARPGARVVIVVPYAVFGALSNAGSPRRRPPRGPRGRGCSWLRPLPPIRRSWSTGATLSRRPRQGRLLRRPGPAAGAPWCSRSRRRRGGRRGGTRGRTAPAPLPGRGDGGQPGPDERRRPGVRREVVRLRGTGYGRGSVSSPWPEGRRLTAGRCSSRRRVRPSQPRPPATRRSSASSRAASAS